MPNMTRADRRGVRRSAGSVLTSLGLTLEEERQYQQLLPLSGGPAADVAIVLGTTEEELGERLAPLLERGLVSLEGSRLVVLTLPALVARLIEEQALTAARVRERLHDLSRGDPVPGRLGDPARSRPDGGARRPRRRAELGRQPAGAAHRLIEHQPGRHAVAAPRRLGDAARVRGHRAGRRGDGDRTASRAIYPLRALHRGARGAARARPARASRCGSSRRCRTRMFIFGDTHAVLPEPLGFADEPRVHVRQRSIVAALTMWFERCGTGPRRARARGRRASASTAAAVPARQLTAGAKDEEIARTLGHQPAHRPPPHRRPDDRARRRHPLPGRRRGGPPRLALIGWCQAARQDQSCTPPGSRCQRAAALGPVDLAVGRQPELLAAHRDRRAAQGSHVVALVVLALAQLHRRSRAWRSGPTARRIITSSRPSSGSASGLSSVPPPTLAPLPIGDHQHRPVDVVDDLAVDLDAQAQLGGWNADSTAPIG